MWGYRSHRSLRAFFVFPALSEDVAENLQGPIFEMTYILIILEHIFITARIINVLVQVLQECSQQYDSEAKHHQVPCKTTVGSQS